MQFPLVREELKLPQQVHRFNELGLAWTETEKGRFRDDYFSSVKIPVIEHIPWAYRKPAYPLWHFWRRHAILLLCRFRVVVSQVVNLDGIWRSRVLKLKGRTSSCTRLYKTVQATLDVTLQYCARL